MDVRPLSWLLYRPLSGGHDKQLRYHQATPNPAKNQSEQLYRIYRSPWKEEKPEGLKMANFRAEASWHVTNADGTSRSPVRFMGIIDTVRFLGIPKVTAGIDVNYPLFYDQTISTEIERVYHACSI